jgi:hypothetical protein
MLKIGSGGRYYKIASNQYRASLFFMSRASDKPRLPPVHAIQ